MTVILRRNKRFCINQEHIKEEHRTSFVINGLYAYIYEEFKGADINYKYKKMTYQERMQQVNTYAEAWLRKRGFYQ